MASWSASVAASGRSEVLRDEVGALDRVDREMPAVGDVMQRRRGVAHPRASLGGGAQGMHVERQLQGGAVVVAQQIARAALAGLVVDRAQAAARVGVDPVDPSARADPAARADRQ